MHSADQAMLLCGGLGTRLRGLFPELPKALVPVCGRPFIEHMIEGLRSQGISRVHVAAGYRADQIKEWAERQTMAGVAITVSVEPAPLGTAGGINYALPFMAEGRSILVLNGDSLLPKARIADLVTAREKKPAFQAVIAAVEMTERGQYGTVEIDENDRITAFKEKADNRRGYVNGGIYLLDTDVLHGIPGGIAVSIEKEIFPQLAEAGRLGAVKIPGPLLDMGTPQGLARTEAFLTLSG
jgi:NDP-sugar pyrophosphorylase family protein